MEIPASTSPPTSALRKRSTASSSARPSRSWIDAAVIGSAPLTRTWSSIDSASRMPPPAIFATSATASGSTVRPSDSRMRRNFPSISGTVSGRKVKRCNLETTAGRIWLGSVVQKMKSTPSGGSSSVLRRTSQPSLMRCTSSMMKTLRCRSAAPV